MIVFRWIGYGFLASSVIALAIGLVKGASAAWDARPPGVCVRGLQETLSSQAPMTDPVVHRCTGDDRDSLCFVDVLEDGQRRTYPFHWDCIGRRLLPPQ